MMSPSHHGLSDADIQGVIWSVDGYDRVLMNFVRSWYDQITVKLRYTLRVEPDTESYAEQFLVSIPMLEIVSENAPKSEQEAIAWARNAITKEVHLAMMNRQYIPRETKPVPGGLMTIEVNFPRRRYRYFDDRDNDHLRLLAVGYG